MIGKPRLYHDVTQLIHWSGPMAGIPRVMNELAVRFDAENSGAIFITWVKEIEAFREVDLRASLANRGSAIVFANDNPSGSAEPEISDHSGQKITTNLKKIVKKGAKIALAQSHRIIPEYSQKIEKRAKQIYMSNWEKVNFRAGDVLFITWGEWWDENYLKLLEAEHTKGLKLSTIIHDIGPMITPQWSGHSSESLAAYCSRIVPLCSAVFCVSEYTKKELGGWLEKNNLKKPEIIVFKNGDNFISTKPVMPVREDMANGKLAKNNFILSVGTVELKKNHLLLYYVYKLALQRGIDLPKLVIAGRKGWKTETTIDLIKNDPELKDKILFLFDGTDEELAWLYDNCLFTVFPSFYEGWGIPIAESLSRGVPCICSNTSSMTEIAEGIVGHFSPASTDECLSAIVKLLDANDLEAARKLTKQYKSATWEEAYQQISNRLKDVL